MYRLVRVLPDGTKKTQSPYETKRAASVGASYVLYDNNLASKRDAQRFASALNKMPLGMNLQHDPSGYQFRIESL